MEDQRRYYGLDALRGSMMLLGVVLHGSQWYVVSPPASLPLPTDPSTSLLFDVIVHFVHSFRMPLFFLMAGFFAALLMAKRGLWGTLANRGKRVAAPLLASCLTILPVTILLGVAFFTSARFGTHHLLPTSEQLSTLLQEIADAGQPLDQPSLLHLWFLYYLLYFYLLIPVGRWLGDRLAPHRDVIARWGHSPGFACALVLLTSATLWPFGGGVVYEGFLFITPHPPSLIYYGTFFLLGYLLHGQRGLLVTFDRWMLWGLCAALLLLPLSLFASASALPDADRAAHLFAVTTNAALTWAMIYAFMGVFLRWLDYDSPWILYVSNSSYWVYLVHLPVISFAAWMVLPLDWHAFVKFPLIVAFTTVVCFASYHYLVQGTWIGAFLNGLRFDMPWPWRASRRAARAAESGGQL